MPRKETIIGLSSFLIACVAAAAAFFIAMPPAWHGTELDFHIQLGTSLFFTIAQFGSGILVLVSLPAYKPNLRRAYSFIVVGIVVNALATIQIPVVNIFDLWQSPWVTRGGVGLPFLVSALFSYFGVRSLTRLVNFKPKLASLPIALGLVILNMALAFFYPHPPTAVSEIAFDMANVIAIACTLLFLWSAILLLQLRNRIGQHYTRSIAWMSAAMFAAGSVTVAVSGNALLTGITNQTTPALIFTEIARGILMLFAGYSFSQTTDYAKPTQGVIGAIFSGGQSGGAITSMLDLVTSTAGLASDPTVIDRQLDTVRVLTSHLTPGQALSTRDETTLLSIYLLLETYLTNKEPLRSFSKEELRARLDTKLKERIAIYESTKK